MVDLRARHRELGPELRAAVERVAASGSFILGPTVASFERALARHCGVPHAVGVASGTDALALALIAGGVEPGDRVITTPLSFIATAEAIVRVGASPLFVDVEEAGLCLSAAAVAGVLSACRRDRRGRLVDPETGARVGAILPVHLYGRVADLDGLAAIATEAGLPLIEDAAQAIGARLGAQRLGAHGAACLSFFPTKNLGGWGDGGAVLTADEVLADRIRALRVHGVREPGVHGELGFNSRLDAIQAAVLQVQFARLDELDQRRRRNAARYSALLAAARLSDWIAPPPELRPGDVCHLYTVMLRARGSGDEAGPAALRAALRAHLDREGIGSAVYYPALLCDQPAIAASVNRPVGPLPVARAATHQVLSLPVHETLAAGAIERVVAALIDFFAGRAVAGG